MTGLNPWTAHQSKLKAVLVAQDTVEVQPQDRWRVQYLRSLLSQRGEAHSQTLEDDVERLTELIDSLVAN